MPDSPGVSPVTLVAGIVIVLGLSVLVIFSPVPWMISSSVSGFFHQPDPDAICLYPPVEEPAMDAIWDTIVERTGIDPSTAVFEDLQAHISPNETLQDLTLTYSAKNSGDWRKYMAFLQYDPETCGTLKIQSYVSVPPDSATVVSRSPREILNEIPSLRPSVFGIRNQTVTVTTGISLETNATYYSLPCTNLFLLENGTIVPLEQIVLHDSRADASHWNIFPQRCIAVPGHGEHCTSYAGILVFTSDRLQSADLFLNTSQSGVIAVQECPQGAVTGQSCEQTIWGTHCENWTVE